MSVEARLRKAKSHAGRGELGAAMAVYREVLARFPENRKAKAGIAAIRAQLPAAPPSGMLADLDAMEGDPKRVAAALGEALQLFPDDAVLLERLAHAETALGRHRAAVGVWERLADALPEHADVQGHLGTARLNAGDANGAVAAFRAVLKLRPDATAWNNLGNAELQRADPVAAKAAYRAALEIVPDHAAALNNLGNLLRDEGDAGAARQAFEAALAVGESAETHWNLAALKRFEAGDPQIARMEALWREAGDADRIHLGFALGRAFDQTGDTARAFDLLTEANRLRKAQLGYEIGQDRALFGHLRQGFPKVREGVARRGNGPVPILIVGLPRSGTTLVEQILSAHGEVEGGGEREEFNAPMSALDWSDAEAFDAAAPKIADAYLATLEGLAGGRAFVTDKMPLNFRWIGPALSLFPEARIVHVRRDARATCWSIFTNYFSAPGNGFGYDLDDLVLYHALYDDLMRHWREVFPGRIVEVDYEALTRDPEVRIRALLDDLGLDWDAACLAPERNTRIVQTASSMQVRRRIYTGSSEAWRRYETLLAGRFDALG